MNFFIVRDDFPEIDAVIYINLDHRPDRRAQVVPELRKHFPPRKIHRLTAIPTNPGWYGCTMSHIAALRWAESEGWNRVMIVEDDFQWTGNFAVGRNQMRSFSPADVVLLCGSYPTYDPTTFRVTSAGTTTGYVVRKEYIPTLRSNFEDGLEKLQAEPDRVEDYCVDQYWKQLMQKDTWYIVIPGMATQRAGVSDIGRGWIDHRNVIA